MASKRASKRTHDDDEVATSSAPTTSAAAPLLHRENVDKSGVLLTLGINCFGQLGVGEDHTERKKPTLVESDLAGHAISAVAAGGMHTIVLTTEGQVFSFGCNDERALAREAATDEDAFLPRKVLGLDGVSVVNISAGDSHSAALADDGRVFATGVFRDEQGALGFSPTTKQQPIFTVVYDPAPAVKSAKVKRAKVDSDPAVAICSGSDHLLITLKSGKILSLGSADKGQLGRVSERSSTRASFRVHGNITSETAAIAKFLTPEEVPHRKLKHAAKVFSGAWSALAIEASGKVFGWGLNNYAQLGISDEEGSFVFTPTHADKWDALNITSFALGQHHVIALSSNGKVYSIGRGDYGRLGHGNNTELTEPKEIEFLADKHVERIAAGTTCSFAICSNGDTYAWGFGENLQLSTGEDDALVPTLMTGKSLENRKIIQVSAGGQHTAIVAVNKPQ